MTVKEILAKLETLGSEKLRAQNKKRGVGDNQFGVKLGDIRKVANGIKADKTLGISLWDSGNYEARLLAILLMESTALSVEELDKLVRTISHPQEADWFNAYLVKDHPDKERLRGVWMTSDDRWAARGGWSLTSGRVARSAEGLDLTALLDRIESEMPTAAPEVQWTMNSTLAQIGIYFPEHRARAIAIGERLGIYRDFPVSKGCTSPFAPIWINELVRRRES